MNQLELIEKFSISAVDTAMKIGGDQEPKTSDYVQALDNNWGEVVQSVKTIYEDYQEAVVAFGEKSEWSKTMFVATYQTEVIRIARIILKSLTDEELPTNH